MLHVQGAAHGIDDACELGQPTVAHQLDGAAAMGGNHGIDQLLPERTKPGHRAFLVRGREPAIASHIAGENRGQPGIRPRHSGLYR